ncbi:MAG TPA: helix-turn-helix domain-containing protein [Candidatus Paceibacterota bacterium]|nr:helix-turn-helix domain-containing protein [Verrucomicrobiota bacterium]HSA09476.1 helix-turn-helix domain-containing protein [Candidatus Paceibacterota bacterium]
MPTVAEQLRQAREARSLTVQQVAEITKIRADHVRAVEEGNYDVFSAPVYIRGFVRTYSTLLKLDVPQVMSALDEELGRTDKFAEPPPLAKHPHSALDYVMLLLSQVDWRKWAIALGAVAIVIGAAWAWVAWRQHNPLKGVKPGMYQLTNGTAGDTLPLPTQAPAPRR